MSDLVKHASGTMAPIADAESESGGTALVHRPDSPVVSGAPAPTATPKHGPGRLAVAVVAASIIAAVAVGAAAFSGGSGTATAGASGAAHGSLAASAANTASAHTVAFTVSATETSPGTVTTLLTGTGAADLSKNVGQVTATIPALSSVTGGGSGSSVTVVSDGTNLYLDVPALSSLTGGKTWLEASVPDAASVSGSSAASAPLSMLTNPSEALALLSSLGSKVQRVGSVQLKGEQTTEYRTTVSVAAIAAKVSHSSQNSKAGKTAAKALQQLGVPTVPVTAWVGNDGLLRQVSVAVDLNHATIGGVLGLLDPSSSATSGKGTSVNLTVGLSDYGQPVSVSVPPASDTTNLNGAFSSVKGAFSKVGGALSGIASRV